MAEQLVIIEQELVRQELSEVPASTPIKVEVRFDVTVHVPRAQVVHLTTDPASAVLETSTPTELPREYLYIFRVPVNGAVTLKVMVPSESTEPLV